MKNREITDILGDMTNKIASSKNLTLDGIPLSREETDKIIVAVNIGIEFVRRSKEVNNDAARKRSV